MNFNFKKKSKAEEFVEILAKLEVLEFCGICTFLGVNLIDDQDNPRNFYDIVSDTLDAFEKCSRAKKREIIRIMKETL